jgi:hypothetical protein
MATVLLQKQRKICVCCVCGDARDDVAADGAWYGLKAHLQRYGIQDQDLMFSHTFCPGCFMRYKEQFGLAPAAPRRTVKARRVQDRLRSAGTVER